MKNNEKLIPDKQIKDRRRFLKYFKGLGVAIAGSALISTKPNEAHAMSFDAMIGSIGLFAGNFVPRGWALCDGSLLPVNNNQALFSLLGNMYGGDGRTNFAVPNLQTHVPIQGLKYCICIDGMYPVRS